MSKLDDYSNALSQFREQWLKWLYSTARADRDITEAAIRETYAVARLPKPTVFVWYDDPLQAGVAVDLISMAARAKTALRPLSERAQDLHDRVAFDLMRRLLCSSIQEVSQVLGGKYHQFEYKSANADSFAVSIASHSTGTLQSNLPPPGIETLPSEPEMSAIVVSDIEFAARRFHCDIDDLLGHEGGPGAPGHPLYPDFITTTSIYSDYPFDFLAKCDILCTLDQQGARHPYSGLVETAKQCAAWWPFQNGAIIAEHPTTVHLDADMHLHSSVGPALAYSSGVRAFAWHGEWVDSVLVDPPSVVTLKSIRSTKRKSVKQLMIELYGRDRYLDAIAD